jgi:hypothetical protein
MTTQLGAPTIPDDLARCWGCITVHAGAASEALDVALMVVARRIEVSTPLARCESCGRSTVLYRLR